MSQTNQSNDAHHFHIDVNETLKTGKLTAKTSVRTNVSNCNVLRIKGSLTAGTLPESSNFTEVGTWDINEYIDFEENIESVDRYFYANTAYFSNGRFVYFQIPLYASVTTTEGPVLPASFTMNVPINPESGVFTSSTQAVGFYADTVPIYVSASAVENTNKIRITIEQTPVSEVYFNIRVIYKI